jgi:glycosyltransferase involved in cell wall biosynthesis
MSKERVVEKDAVKEFIKGTGFTPTKIIEIELSRPLPKISEFDHSRSRFYRRVHILTRILGCPVGIAVASIPTGGLSPEVVAQIIWESLSKQINRYLLEKTLNIVDELTPAGLNLPNLPHCNENHFSEGDYPFVSVIICTHERSDSLRKTLDSVTALNFSDYEIVVVDNAPKTTSTWDLIEQHYSDRVRYIREDHPGLSIARNRGVTEALGEIVAFTDDDVIVDKEWLWELINAFLDAENVACVTGNIIPAELETPSQAIFEEYGAFNKGFSKKIFDKTDRYTRNPLLPYSAGVYGTGASMAFRTDFLKSIGGFDPATGSGTPTKGGDDLAAFFEVISRGYRLVYEPAAIVHHQHRRDYESLRNQAFGYGCGLTAFLTKTILDNPARFFDLAARFPSGLSYIFDPASRKNRSKSTHFPKELTRVEYKGMLYGPFAYLRSKWIIRKLLNSKEKEAK